MAQRSAKTAPEHDPTKLLAGILMLLIAEREERTAGDGDAPPKTEVLLSKAGFSGPEIAGLTGKNADAVRKTLQRSRT